MLLGDLSVMHLRFCFSILTTAVLLALFSLLRADAQSGWSPQGSQAPAQYPNQGQYAGQPGVQPYPGQFPGAFPQNQGQGQYPAQAQGQYPPQNQGFPGQSASPGYSGQYPQYGGQPGFGGPFPGQQNQGYPQSGQQPMNFPAQYPMQGSDAGARKTTPPGKDSQSAKKGANPQQAAKVYRWFLNYDEIRRRAQMNPIERQQADGMLARGLGLFMPGQDKMAARMLLSSLVARYQTATRSIQALAPLPETRQLQELYFQYFDTAMRLFSDYLVVQENVFAVDNGGQSVAKQLLQRKVALENLEKSCKNLDAQMRLKYGVAPYQY